MPRRPNTRPTHIYWLIDIRPEIIAAGWGRGQPFYCGKTVLKPEQRMWQHKREAITKSTLRPVLARIKDCGEHVRIHVMEVVPVEMDWVIREKHWISLLRFSFPDSVNISDGGTGTPGWVQSEATKKKRSAKLKGRPLTVEHRSKLSAAKLGKKHTPESRAKIARINAARYDDPAFREKIAAASRRMWQSESYRAKYAANRTGVKRSADVGAKISASKKGIPGKPASEETRRKMSASQKAQWAARKGAEVTA